MRKWSEWAAWQVLDLNNDLPGVGGTANLPPCPTGTTNLSSLAGPLSAFTVTRNATTTTEGNRNVAAYQIAATAPVAAHARLMSPDPVSAAAGEKQDRRQAHGRARRLWLTGRGGGFVVAALLALFAVFGAVPDAGAAIAVNATSSGSGTGTTINVTHTVSGTDRLMLVGISAAGGVSGLTISSVVWDPTGVNEALTLVGSRTGPAGDAKMWIYQKLAPTTGTRTLRVTFGAGTQSKVVGVVSFTGVNQSTPLGTFVSDRGTGRTASVSVTSATGELVFDTVAVEDAASMTAGANQTPPLWNLRSGVTLGGGSTEAGAASVTMSWSLASVEKWAIGAVPIKPAAGVTIDHFSISHSGSGIACVDQTITIAAHDASHNAVNANGLTVNLSTTNGRGTWTGIVSGGGTLSDPTAGDGAASYTFAAGSTSVQLSFRYANLAASSETFGFNVSGGGFSETTGTANASDDPSFTMAQAGFQFRNVTDGNTTILTQISGKPSDTGFNAKTVRVQAIRTDTVTGSCSGLFASQTRTVDLGAECNNPTTCAGQQASINGTNIATSNNNGGAGAAAYTGVSLTFNASSEADTVIAYPDAGQISLHARYDFDPSVAGFEMVGSSNAFVVRPFGFAFRGANAATAIQHSTTETGTVLVPAGDNFTMTLAAVRWAAGEDADDDGVPDAGVDVTNNGLTPNFAASVAVAPSGNLPGVALGAISRGVTCASAGTIAAGSFSSGAATVSDWCYSEAGNVFLNATSNNYISAGVNITGDSGLDGTGAAGGYVGRFRPKNFVISGIPTLTNRSAATCAPASAFTYMNEGLALAFTLVARNTQGATTQNYNGVYATLGIGTFANFNFGAKSGTTDLISRVDSGTSPAGSWSSGLADVTAVTGIRRATPDNPDGPYTAVQFGIAPVDSDGVAMNMLDFDADGNTVNERANLGVTTEVRFGRLRLGNAHGSELLDLPLPVKAEYYDGNAFVINTGDSCTTLSASDIRFDFVAGTPNLVACETHLNPAGTITFNAGVAAAKLTKPGAGNNGSVDLTVNLGALSGSTCTSASSSPATGAGKPYLQGNWGSGTYTDNPRARATFGVYKNADEFIYQRENF